MGRGNRVSHGATLGSAPQDLSYRPDKAKPLTIGDFNQFRECANISQGIKTDQGTRIGSHNYFMAFSHVGHDCQVGDHNILANSATLAGHVALEHHIFLSGQVAVHQFCRIGAYAMGSLGRRRIWPAAVKDRRCPGGLRDEGRVGLNSLGACADGAPESDWRPRERCRMPDDGARNRCPWRSG